MGQYTMRQHDLVLLVDEPLFLLFRIEGLNDHPSSHLVSIRWQEFSGRVKGSRIAYTNSALRFSPWADKERTYSWIRGKIRRMAKTDADATDISIFPDRVYVNEEVTAYLDEQDYDFNYLDYFLEDGKRKGNTERYKRKKVP